MVIGFRIRNWLGRPRTLLISGVLVMFVGGGILAEGFTDYTDHTARTPATVVDVDTTVTRSGTTGSRQEKVDAVYVAYWAEGRRYFDVKLEGIGSTEPSWGETIKVAYAPGKPGHVVTPESTKQGAYDASLYIGSALMPVGGAIIVLGIVRRRRTTNQS